MLPCKIENLWASWQAKGTSLNAIDHSHQYLLKSRQVDISNCKNVDIFNCIAYPKTNADVPTGLLPCFGMDLMKFSPKKIIIVFDFQHPTEDFLFRKFHQVHTKTRKITSSLWISYTIKYINILTIRDIHLS